MHDENWLVVWTMIVIAVALLGGLRLALRIVNQVEADLRPTRDDPYTILIARFPDPLILHFGYERRLLDLPRSLRLSFESWGEKLEGVLLDPSYIAYANRNTAIAASASNRRITLREKRLCTYHGFSICLMPSKGREKTEELAARLSNGYLLVRDDTDQHNSLTQLLLEFGLTPGEHIVAVRSNQDILELALGEANGKRSSVDVAGVINGRPLIGFAGGITERLLAQKIGYDVFDQTTILPKVEEANSFAYLYPESPEKADDLGYVLGQLEALWSEAVRQITTEEGMRNDFRGFLNTELRAQLGPLAKTALRNSGKPLVTHEDMTHLLGSWLRFNEKPA